MTPAERFFYEQAGYAYDPKTETPEQGRLNGARELARAERYAKDAGWHAEWTHDPTWNGETLCSHVGAEKCTPREVLDCVLYDARGVTIASLGAIGDPSRDYARVVEAELASEALAHIESLADNDRAAGRYMAL